MRLDLERDDQVPRPIGDIVEAVVLTLDKDKKRISLGMKQTEPNPWDEIEKKYPIGSEVQGVVRNLTDFGAFVELEDGVDGLIHISDLSWNKKIKHPSEVLKKKDEVTAAVTGRRPWRLRRDRPVGRRRGSKRVDSPLRESTNRTLRRG